MPVLPPSAGGEIEPLSGGAAGQQRAGKNEMARITPEELDYIRTAAVGDMLGDSKALDEVGPAAIIFRLCQEIRRLDREADVLSIWLANAYIDIDLMPDIDSGAMNPPLPEDVREAAREAVGEGEESCPKN